jgi:cell wall-associated NlpC family hydrolase
MDLTGRRNRTIAALILTAPLLVLLAIATIAGGTTTGSASCTGGRIFAGQTIGGVRLDTDQLNDANLIINVGYTMAVPPPGEVIAVATAMQESGLRNLDHGDRDSLGLFQQRPSMGWGSPAQILNPIHASQEFYSHLLAVPGWRTMTTTQAAQAVQHSATPDAYQRWQPLAQALVSGTSAPVACADGTANLNGTAVAAADYRIPPGTPAPIAAVIEFGLAQLGKPYVYGATGPNAWDCSSLVQAAYAQIGIQLPRTTYQQVTVGEPVYGTSDLQPGDLLFIPGSDGTPTNPGHVGMYVGDQLVLEAPHLDATVRLSPLEQWTSSLAAIRRIIEP